MKGNMEILGEEVKYKGGFYFAIGLGMNYSDKIFFELCYKQNRGEIEKIKIHHSYISATAGIMLTKSNKNKSLRRHK